MKKVFLYERVSTDEQAKHGSSLRDQDARLIEDCQKQGDEVVGIFTDDFTGKTFDRPGFNKMLDFLRKNQVNEIRFINWRRFSRDTTDAFAMIRKLRDKKIGVQAIDEPIDFTTPHSKFMLAFYLTSGEVDNDMRSAATEFGMRRNKLEGRYMAGAPYGYFNMRDELNKPIIVPDAEKSYFVYQAFELMATAGISQNELRVILNAQGAKLTKSRLSVILQQPIYCGKIIVKAFKNEPAQMVTGIHEPIIDEETFSKVQQVLKGNRKVKSKRYHKVKDEFPIIGYVYCNAGHKMTGSSSRGRRRGEHIYHSYYHCCNHLHCERERAKEVNDAFVRLLKSVKVKEGGEKLYQMARDFIRKPQGGKLITLRKDLEMQERRLLTAEDDYVDRRIDFDEYQRMKIRYQAAIYDLKYKIGLITGASAEFSSNLVNGVTLLSSLPEYYDKATAEGKRSILGSIIDGKVYYFQKECRTQDWKPAIRLLCNVDAGSKEKRDSESFEKPAMSRVVTLTGHYLEPSASETQLISLNLRQLSDTLNLLKLVA